MSSVAFKIESISVSDYLAGEINSRVKHEYVDGRVYAMAGAENVHNLLASRVQGSFFEQLRGSKCEAYNSDTKIRIRLRDSFRFYYPDISVTCRPNSLAETYQDEPCIIVEVLSRSTRRIDEGEKRDAYLSITTLELYIMLDSERLAATVYRRADIGIACESYAGLDASISLGKHGSLVLADIYRGIVFETAAEEE